MHERETYNAIGSMGAFCETKGKHIRKVSVEVPSKLYMHLHTRTIPTGDRRFLELSRQFLEISQTVPGKFSGGVKSPVM